MLQQRGRYGSDDHCPNCVVCPVLALAPWHWGRKPFGLGQTETVRCVEKRSQRTPTPSDSGLEMAFVQVVHVTMISKGSETGIK